jgi:hypothetical protein
MSDESTPPDPPRLSGEGDETGELMRSADAEFRKRIDESGAFRSIERTRRVRAVVSWGVAGIGAVAAVAILLQRPGQFGSTPIETTLTAERLPPMVPAEPSVAKPTDEPAARLEAPRSSPPAARTAEAERVDEAGCEKLALGGETERALSCFRTLARGSGLGAEVASYKAARISAERLRDATRAIQLLDEHAARFPSGALRGEVRWLRVQSLEKAGRLDEALSESEALLAAPEGRALASDIHWLRARIYEGRSDCQSAVSALVALVGEAGERGDEAEMRRAACLERLGRTSEARAAYEKYLERAAPRRADEARAKVEALRP